MERRLPREKAYDLARPYAKAVFDIASDDCTMDEWRTTLIHLTKFVQDREVVDILTSPHVTKEDVRDLMTALLAEAKATPKEYNLVMTMADNKHLLLAPLVLEQFMTLRNEAEGKLDVNLLSAQKFTPNQMQNLKDYLKDRFNIKANVHERSAPDLQSGFVIMFDKVVIDQSMKGQIARQKKTNKP